MSTTAYTKPHPNKDQLIQPDQPAKWKTLVPHHQPYKTSNAGCLNEKLRISFSNKRFLLIFTSNIGNTLTLCLNKIPLFE